MPRPLRIEFENALYHVMNRGAAKKNIFKTRTQKDFFLSLLSEANTLFGLEVHAYCLMSNHYHLLLRTPHANLSRAMRHINGIYTQYFNREMGTDGSLFRGRYKAIIVSYDEYFLNVSRYIHLNPVEAKITNNALDFEWSSYRYFVTVCKKPSWLYIGSTLALFSSDNQLEEYRKFIELGLNSETLNFYNKKHKETIFSSKEFKHTILDSINNKKRFHSSADYNRTRPKYTFREILDACTKVFDISENVILSKKNGKMNLPRKIAIYACRIWSGEKIATIASKFSCKSSSNISDIYREVKKRCRIESQIGYLIESINTELLNLPKTRT